jgi:hypothetical protein
MENTTKTAAEWLEHLPLHFRKLVKESRNALYEHTNGEWSRLYSSLYEMVLCSKEGLPKHHRLDPIWNELYIRLEAGMYKKMWRKADSQAQESVYKKYPVGSKWIIEVEIEIGLHDKNDKNLVVYCQPKEVGGWLTPSQLDKLKPLNF